MSPGRALCRRHPVPRELPAPRLRPVEGREGADHGLDLAAVARAPGVHLVLAGEDLPFDTIPDCSPSAHDEPLLSDGSDPLRGPAAVPRGRRQPPARAQGRRAWRGVEIAEEETPILTIDEALAAGSIFEEGPRVYTKGDVEAALARAPMSSRAGSRSAGRSISTSKASPRWPCRRKAAT
jgi:xanthine dehydrogenase molybdopterin-binding subunit B